MTIASAADATQRAGVVSIHQPHYLPWLGLIAKIACSDVHIVLDNVQFEKNGWQNRTRYSARGGLKFLTLPVCQTGVVSGARTIADIELADPGAPRKHWRTLRQRYGKEPGWARVGEHLEAILNREHDSLLPLAMATTKLTLEAFAVETPTIPASRLRVAGRKSERLVNLVEAVGGSHYLSGAGAKDYLDAGLFAKAGVNLSYQEFHHPRYRQMGGHAFVPGAFALEWYFADPDGAAAQFHRRLGCHAGRRGYQTE